MERTTVKHIALLLMIAALAALPACTVVPPLAGQVDPALLDRSDELRLARQENAAVPLDERIAMIEADMERTLVEVGDGVLVPRFLRHDGRKGPVQIEHNAAVLSALAAKHAATGDESAKALGERLIKGIMELDALTGELDGLVSFYADARTLEPTDHDTHANVYTQLLFAYVLADAHFGANDDIREHVSLIYQRWLADDFRLRQRDGSFTSRANLRIIIATVNARQALGRRLLDEAAYQLGDEHTRELVQQHRWHGPLIGPLHVRFWEMELPTTSSSWLSLQNLTALTMLGESYERRAISLARRYQRDNNPLFRIFAAMNGADEDLTAVRQRLEEFPYPATSSGIINSHRAITRAGHRYIKWNAKYESHEPLPLYEIGSSNYLWKNALREMDSLPVEDPNVLLGHDLYQAYWLLRALETKH